jgi:hypothetical protein
MGVEDIAVPSFSRSGNRYIVAHLAPANVANERLDDRVVAAGAVERHARTVDRLG